MSTDLWIQGRYNCSCKYTCAYGDASVYAHGFSPIDDHQPPHVTQPMVRTASTTNLWIYVVSTFWTQINGSKSAPIPLPQEKDYCKAYLTPLFLPITCFTKWFHKQYIQERPNHKILQERPNHKILQEKPNRKIVQERLNHRNATPSITSFCITHVLTQETHKHNFIIHLSLYFGLFMSFSNFVLAQDDK